MSLNKPVISHNCVVWRTAGLVSSTVQYRSLIAMKIKADRSRTPLCPVHSEYREVKE